MESQNASMNSSNSTGDDNQLNFAYILIGVGHIAFVVIPVSILGPILLYFRVPEYKKTKSTISIIFIFITLLCTIAPCTYGLLMDLSLITDVPLLTSVCSISLFYLTFTCCHITLSVTSALLSGVQYVVIRWRSGKKVNVISISLLIILVLSCLIVTITVGINVSSVQAIPLRGSLCITTESRSSGVGTLIYVYTFVFYLPSVGVVAIFSILTYIFVKKNTVENVNRIGTVVKILITTTIFAILFRLLPSASVALVASTRQIQIVFSFILTYSLELSYPLYLFLLLFIHKSVKETFKKKMKILIQQIQSWSSPNQVLPFKT